MLFKLVVYGGGAASALIAAFLIGSLTLGGAFAQANSTAPAQSQAQSQAQPAASDPSEAQDEQGVTSDQSESAALANHAKVTAEQATAAALAQFPGATAGKIELDNENGMVVYSVQLTDRSGKGQDVKVDAATGKVVQTQADGTESPDGPDTGGQTEGPETED